VPEASAALGGAAAAAPVIVGAALAFGGLWLLMRRPVTAAPAAIALVVLALGVALVALPRLIPDRSGAPRLALHAARLGFPHPITGEELSFEALLPEDLAHFLERLRKQGQAGNS